MNTACQRKWPCESCGTQQEHEEELKYFILTALFFTPEDQTSAESQGQILVHEWGPGCGAGRVYGLTETIKGNIIFWISVSDDKTLISSFSVAEVWSFSLSPVCPTQSVMLCF